MLLLILIFIYNIYLFNRNYMLNNILVIQHIVYFLLYYKKHVNILKYTLIEII